MTEDECVNLLTAMKWPEWKARIAFRADFHCEYCDRDLLATIEDHRVIEFDHIVPVKKGGPDAPENMAVCCRLCNWLKRHHIVPPAHLIREEAIAYIREDLVAPRELQHQDLEQIRKLCRPQGLKLSRNDS